MKFQHGQRLDTFDALEALGPGDRVTIAGKPATVFDVVEGDEVYIVYVLDGRKTKKELSMFDAVLPSETQEDEEYDDYDNFGEPDPNFVEEPEVEVRYIAPGKDMFDEPGLRKSPGRRNRPMTSLVPPVAEGKTMRITKNQLLKVIREALSTEVPDIRPHRKSSFQVRKEKELAAKRNQPRYVGPTVPSDMMNRIDALRRGDLQDHLYDIVDAIESGDPDYTMQTLKLNLRDAEKLDRQ